MTRIGRYFSTAAGMTTLALAAACAPADGTWTGRDFPNNDFNDPSNWTPRGVPTGIATIPSKQPPQPLLPLVEIKSDVSVDEIRNGGSLAGGFGTGDAITIALTGKGLTTCGQWAAASLVNVTIRGSVTLCPAPAIDTGHSQSGIIHGNVMVQGGGFGPHSFPPSPRPPANLGVGGSVTVERPGALVAVFSNDAQPILDVQGTITLKDATLLVDTRFFDKPGTTTVVAIKAKAGITGTFASVLPFSAAYDAKVAYLPPDRPTEIQVTVTRRPQPRGRQAAVAPAFNWPPGPPPR